MIFTCIGHAKFLMELDNGMRIVTDPYDATCGYPVMPMAADTVLVSHGHHDHNAVDTISGYTQVIDEPGVYTSAPDVKVTAVAACHDDQGGAQRGRNLLFLIEAEGLRVAHLGDLGHVLTAEQAKALSPVDVVMIPVGGHFTIDAKTACEVAKQLQARVVLPMHYKTVVNAGWPIKGVEEFLMAYGKPSEELDLLRVAKGDLACQPEVAVLKPQSLK